MTERQGSGGAVFLTPGELRRALEERTITDIELDRVLEVLSQPDPAGTIRPPTRVEVAHVAAYLHGRVGRGWVPNWPWVLLERRHPAALAIWWHELQQLETYRQLEVSNPLRVKRGGTTYWKAHAWASWQEAHYWSAWAATAAEQIPPEAFFLEHLIREGRGEIPHAVRVLDRAWGIDVGKVPVLVSRRAREFYRARQMTLQDVERWLRR